MTEPDLSDRMRNLVELVGRRADDPDLIAYVTGELGKKVPGSMTDRSDGKYVTANKQGIEMLFSHDVLHRRYPKVKKRGASYVPYLEVIWLKEKLAEPLPFGVDLSMSDEELAGVLGEPSGRRGFGDEPFWSLPLDPERGVVADISSGDVRLKIAAARLLARGESAAAAGVFLAWCATSDLLDPETLAEHQPLLDELRRTGAGGSELFEALDRGLWDDHLRDRPGLRDFAHAYFHRLGDDWITRDLIEVFGGREGPHGHQEPDLDDDDADAVSRATPIFNRKLGRWIGGGPA